MTGTGSEIVIDFLSLRFTRSRVHEQYYGFSKVVTDSWKIHNIVHGYQYCRVVTCTMWFTKPALMAADRATGPAHPALAESTGLCTQ